MINFSGEDQAHVLRLVHGFVELSDTVRGQHSELLHHATGLVPEAVTLRVHQTLRPQLHQLSLVVLDTLHLRVDDTRVFALAIDVVNLGVATLIGQSRHDQVLKVYGQDLSKTIPAGSLKSVGSLIGGSPCVCGGVSAGGEFVEKALITVRFGAHEAQVLESVRRSRIVVDLGCQSKVSVHFRTLLIDDNATHAGASRLILGDGDRSIFELELLDDFEVRAALLSGCWHIEKRPSVLGWEDSCSSWQFCSESTAKEDWLEEANCFFSWRYVVPCVVGLVLLLSSRSLCNGDCLEQRSVMGVKLLSCTG